MEKVGLREALGALRAELSEAILAAAREDLRFQVDDVSMEFRVEIEKSAGASGGVKFWVVQLGGEVSRTSTLTHSLTLSLTPMSADGKPVLTGGGIVPD